MADTEVNVHVLDAAYKPFPTFEEWVSKTSIDAVRWDRYKSSLENHKTSSPELLKRAQEIAKRAAALDTGAIEDLYEVDRGFTYTVAFETASWEAALAGKGERIRPLFDAQMRAYDYVLDLATKTEPISEAAVRALHEVVCEAQETYRVVTAVGPQEQVLPKGQYKVLPNHVRTRKATDHSYAPVDVTPAEMARLVLEMRSQEFLVAHPVLQAAYAHYGLVVIHPFADGNGRVARALASAFTYRAIAMPIVILSEHKNSYLDSLEEADEGDYQRFVDFMLSRSIDTIRLVDESVRSAKLPSLGQSVSAINALYVTRGGYTHDEVDAAGSRLFDAFVSEAQRVIAQNQAPKVGGSATITRSMYPVPSNYRVPLGGGFQATISLTSAAPAHAMVSTTYALMLPTDAAGHDEIRLAPPKPGEDEFTARMDELMPAIAGVPQIRLRMFAERTISGLFQRLKESAEKKLREGR